jgi:hypothetical protein
LEIRLAGYGLAENCSKRKWIGIPNPVADNNAAGLVAKMRFLENAVEWHKLSEDHNMSKAITKGEFFAAAKPVSTSRQFEQMQQLVDFIEKDTCLSLAYTKAKAHHTLTASYVRPDGGRCKVFSCYENGQAMCQHVVELPPDVPDLQRSAIKDAYQAYREDTGGADGTSWGWFSISSITLAVLTGAIGELAANLDLQFRPR